MIRRIRRWYRSIRFRLDYGFSYEETWNLDITLAAWLGKRLLGLAMMTNGHPAGYGSTLDDTGMAFWVKDLMKHSEVSLRYADKAFGAEHEDAYVLYVDFKNTLQWVTDHVEHLWW